jgi:thiol-disulfide isomerase/thioredoxin
VSALFAAGGLRPTRDQPADLAGHPSKRELGDEFRAAGEVDDVDVDLTREAVTGRGTAMSTVCREGAMRLPGSPGRTKEGPMGRTGRLAALLAAIAVLLTACGGGETADGPSAPDLEFENFDGELTSLSEFRGQPVVVNFWASWCAPCIAEMPDFERVHQDLQGQVRFLGLNTQDDRASADELVEFTGVTYDLALDPDGELFRAFGVIAMPTTYFVNEDGIIVHRHSGLATEQQLRGLIDEHLEP